MAQARTDLQIDVNGERRTMPAGSSVSDLIRQLGLAPAQVAVERNKVLVKRADHAATPLADGDHLEVGTLFGGG